MCLLLSPNLFSVQTDLLDIVDTDMQREILSCPASLAPLTNNRESWRLTSGKYRFIPS